MANEKSSAKISGIRQKTHDSVDKIMDKAENIRESGKEDIAYLKEKAIMMRGNFDSYIQRNPEKSVFIAAGIGVVIGAILAAAMMKRKRQI